MQQNYFKELAEDLLNIEINTIVKSEMAATKLPSSRRQALYELARDYDLKLKTYNVREPIYWAFAGLRSFGELRDRAREGKLAFEKQLVQAAPFEQADLQDRIYMLQRIEDQSSQMVDIFKSLEAKVKDQVEKSGYRGAPAAMSRSRLLSDPGQTRAPEDRDSQMWNNDIERTTMNNVDDLDLTPQQVGRIRKAWEIGTEKIQLQTVIQIDGDVTTRISESFLKNVDKTLLAIHNDSIATSTGFWNSLVRTLSEMAGQAVRQVFGR